MKEAQRGESEGKSVGSEKWDSEMRSAVWERKGGKDTDMIGDQPVAPFVACPGRLLIWAMPHTRQMQHYVCPLRL